MDSQQKYGFEDLPTRSQESVFALLRCAILDPEGHEIQAGKSGIQRWPYSYRVVLSGNRPLCPPVNEDWDLGYRLMQIEFTMIHEGGSWDKFRFRPEIIDWFRSMNPLTDAQVREAVGRHFYDFASGDDSLMSVDAEDLSRRIGVPPDRVMAAVRILEGSGLLAGIRPLGSNTLAFVERTERGFQWAMNEFKADIGLSPLTTQRSGNDLVETKETESVVDAPKVSSAKPRIFIGSSSEGLEIAEFVQLGLAGTAEAVVWTQGVFGLSGGTLEDIVEVAPTFDFAALVLTQDDVRTKRGKAANSPRDNVVFELGLFMGALGRRRTFMILCKDEPLDLPSDLAGVTVAGFHRHSDNNLQAALGPVCTQLKREMQNKGLRNK